MKHPYWIASLLFVAVGASCAYAEHPQLLTTPAERAALVSKVETAPWAKAAYTERKAEVDKYMPAVAKDPKYLSSRLVMHWNTRYTTPVLARSKERWVGGEGKAPVPTPHFAGARDWAGKYGTTSIEEMKPYADENDKVWMVNKETGKAAWADPAETGHSIETANRRLMDLASYAAFIYFLTGDEKYAKYATEIFWTYMEGFSHTTPAKWTDGGTNTITGLTSFEVIHESIVNKLATTYDFLQPYLVKQGKDVKMVQAQFKRMADNIADGGANEGNWNLHQANRIAYAGMVLEENAAYADGKGRGYYMDIVLHAKTPYQTGILKIIETAFDKETGLWPESPGYSFGTSTSILEIAAPLATDPKNEAAQAILNHPVLQRATLAQAQLLFPNGLSIGQGDTYHEPVQTHNLEILIPAARKRGDAATEKALTTALQREIDSGRYDRSSVRGEDFLLAITKFAAELQPVSSTKLDLPRTFIGPVTNVIIQRNVVDSVDHSLMAVLLGTKGGHYHLNGMALEIFGAGQPLGADPGRGTSYWVAEQGQYYKMPPAHNTVIVNAVSSYSDGRWGNHPVTVDLMEPAVGAAAVSPHMSVVQGSFGYDKPKAEQQRTVALIRTSATAGFFVDIYRSRAAEAKGEFHDYLYHNIGQGVVVTDGAGKPLTLGKSAELTTARGAMKGYDYFKNERSAEQTDTVRATFSTDIGDGVARQMAMWIPAVSGRRLFAVDAPPARSVRTLKQVVTLPMPTVIVRQTGEAWKRPFVTVYEPFLGKDRAQVRSLRQAKTEGETVAGVVVETEKSSFVVMQDAVPEKVQTVEGDTFQGSFATVRRDGGAVVEMYLANGTLLTAGDVTITAEKPGSISLRRANEGAAWTYSSTVAMRVNTGGKAPRTQELPAGQDRTVAAVSGG